MELIVTVVLPLAGMMAIAGVLSVLSVIEECRREERWRAIGEQGRQAVEQVLSDRGRS